MSGTNDFVIEATGIVKRFAGVPALRGIDFASARGEIHALLGQNGAGKSTLVKILNGVHPAGSFDGEIRLDGAARRLSLALPAPLPRGIAYVPQEIEVLEQLTVAENVFAGQTGLGGLPRHRRACSRSAPRALFDDFGLAIDPRALSPRSPPPSATW